MLNRLSQGDCWLCGAPHPATTIDRRAAYQFGLSSLFLTTLLVALVLSVYRLAPALGICLAILAVPALLHTCVAVARKSVRGQAVSVSEKASTFARALGAAGAIVLMLLVFYLLSILHPTGRFSTW
jgi:hypothetical protein